eukprot:597293-Rhodomonas_salina.1
MFFAQRRECPAQRAARGELCARDDVQRVESAGQRMHISLGSERMQRVYSALVLFLARAGLVRCCCRDAVCGRIERPLACGWVFNDS